MSQPMSVDTPPDLLPWILGGLLIVVGAIPVGIAVIIGQPRINHGSWPHYPERRSAHAHN